MDISSSVLLGFAYQYKSIYNLHTGDVGIHMGSSFLHTSGNLEPETNTVKRRWKIIIVDDDESVHAVTRMILRNFVYQERRLDLISAYTEEEAHAVLQEHSDAAVILLDVVMSEEDSGLKIAQYIRDTLKNQLIRIILRTGQPGQAPEKQVIIDYDINDYKLKTELTADKLFVTMVAALRSYEDLLVLDYNRIGLEKIIESSAALFRIQNYREFIQGVLIQLISIMRLDKDAAFCRSSALSAKRSGSTFFVEAAIGEYANGVQQPIEEVLPQKALDLIKIALEKKDSVYEANKFIAYFKTSSDMENLIYFSSDQEIAPWNRRLLKTFCTNVSVGLDNLNLGREIENTQKEIIITLGEVAEARSRETGHHVKRVAEYAAILAREVGLHEDQIRLLKMACPMHDIGKLAIPDAILNKPASLDEEEMAIIKTHTQAGYDMLKTSGRPLMRLAAQIALEHHEKYDGSGYPLGKKGNDISIEGRIVAIADVYDALGNDRVYKKAWPQEDIVKFFKEVRGTWFDPLLCDIFIQKMPDMQLIGEKYPD